MSRKTAMMPTMTTSTIGGRVITTLITLAVLTLVLRDPVGTAHSVRALLTLAGSVIDGLATFASALSAQR
jgi:hypothetical protein